MKKIEWGILVILMFIISYAVHDLSMPYISKYQLSRNDLHCSGCLEVHTYHKDFDEGVDLSQTFILKPVAVTGRFWNTSGGDITIIESWCHNKGDEEIC